MAHADKARANPQSVSPVIRTFFDGVHVSQVDGISSGERLTGVRCGPPNADQKRGANGVSMNNLYLEVISLVERLHRQFLEVVKLELDGFGIHDINNVQAMMLFNIGDAEMTVGELTLRGCYLGSNVSYNVKKMVENGYLAHERSVHDRRSIHVRLTEKGIKLRDNLTAMHRRHAEMLSQAAIGADDLQGAGVTLRRLERFWIRAADLVQRPPQFAA